MKDITKNPIQSLMLFIPLLLLFIPLMSASSCEPQEDKVSDIEVEPVEKTKNPEISIINIEGHDYILWENNPGHNENVGGICHSESCSNTNHTK